VLEDFPDMVRLVVKPFPALDNPSSLLAAHAQGRFWEFRQALFSLPGPTLEDLLQAVHQAAGRS
jgi:hypothetical protein